MKYVQKISILLIILSAGVSNVFALLPVEGGGGTGYFLQESYRMEREMQCKKSFGDFFLCIGEDSLPWFHFLFSFDLIIYVIFFLALGILFALAYLLAIRKTNFNKVFFKRFVKVLIISILLAIFLPVILILLKHIRNLF